MNLTYVERQELNTLSKEILGASSRWRTVVRKGVPDRFTKIAPKVWQQYRKYLYTFDEIKAYLLEMQTLQAKHKKTTEQPKAKPVEKKTRLGQGLIDGLKSFWWNKKANDQK